MQLPRINQILNGSNNVESMNIQADNNCKPSSSRYVLLKWTDTLFLLVLLLIRLTFRWNEFKHLGKIWHLLEFIPSRNLTTHMET